jgi:hypothetical protein
MLRTVIEFKCRSKGNLDSSSKIKYLNIVFIYLFPRQNLFYLTNKNCPFPHISNKFCFLLPSTCFDVAYPTLQIDLIFIFALHPDFLSNKILLTTMVNKVATATKGN